MRAPADNFHDLRLNIGMFAGLLAVLYGEKCDFYWRVFDIYQVMTHPAVSAMKAKFTPLLCRQITWAIHDDKSSFFHQRLHPDDFKGASMPVFPRHSWMISFPTYPSKMEYIDLPSQRHGCPNRQCSLF